MKAKDYKANEIIPFKKEAEALLKKFSADIDHYQMKGNVEINQMKLQTLASSSAVNLKLYP